MYKVLITTEQWHAGQEGVAEYVADVVLTEASFKWHARAKQHLVNILDAKLAEVEVRLEGIYDAQAELRLEFCEPNPHWTVEAETYEVLASELRKVIESAESLKEGEEFFERFGMHTPEFRYFEIVKE